MRISLIVVALTVVAPAHLALAAGPWEVSKSDQGLVVKKDGQLVTEYLVKSGNKPILWPVIGPTGKEMTRAYPMRMVEGEKKDHVHQRSLWFTHGSVNGFSFWEEVNPKKEPGEQRHRTFKQFDGGQQATIVSQTDWLGDGKRVLEDERTLVFRDEGGARVLDYKVVLTASEGDVHFGETKEGSFGIRVPTSMDVDSKQGGKIINDVGQTDADAWGQKASWVDYHGPVAGETLGIAVLNHPKSFRYPTRWHVRTYGLFAANPWGVKDFTGGKETGGEYTLPKGESLTLSYRVIFHKGDEKEGKIAEAWEKYSAQ